MCVPIGRCIVSILATVKWLCCRLLAVNCLRADRSTASGVQHLQQSGIVVDSAVTDTWGLGKQQQQKKQLKKKKTDSRTLSGAAVASVWHNDRATEIDRVVVCFVMSGISSKTKGRHETSSVQWNRTKQTTAIHRQNRLSNPLQTIIYIIIAVTMKRIVTLPNRDSKIIDAA